MFSRTPSKGRSCDSHHGLDCATFVFLDVFGESPRTLQWCELLLPLPSTGRGQGVRQGVRGGLGKRPSGRKSSDDCLAAACSSAGRSERFHPSPSIPLPVEGRGRSVLALKCIFLAAEN